MIGRLCEEFPGALPSAIREESLSELLGILEMRAFARAKSEIDAYDPETDPKGENRPKGPLIELVEDIKYTLIQEMVRGSPDRG